MSTTRPSLRQALADYLNLRRALGYRLANAARLLAQFVGHFETLGMYTYDGRDDSSPPTCPARA
jgi:hypothetical protein